MLWLYIHSSLIKNALYSQSFTKTSDLYTCLFLSQKQIPLTDMSFKQVTSLQACKQISLIPPHCHTKVSALMCIVYSVSVTALFWRILYLFINTLWKTGPKHSVIQTVKKLRKCERKFISNTWHYIVNVTGRCVQHWIYLHPFFLKKEKVWGVAKSSVGGTTSFQKQNLQSYNTTWEVQTLKDNYS